IARHKIDGEFRIERHLLRTVQQHLEGRQTIGLFLERECTARARSLSGLLRIVRHRVVIPVGGVLPGGRRCWLDVLQLELRRVVARRWGGGVELVIKTTESIDLYWDAP